jgi:hypothetical protein
MCRARVASSSPTLGSLIAPKEWRRFQIRATVEAGLAEHTPFHLPGTPSTARAPQRLFHHFPAQARLPVAAAPAMCPAPAGGERRRVEGVAQISNG